MRYQDWVESLTLQNYNDAAERFKQNGKLLHAVFGIAGESGELLDAVKKHVFYGKELDKTNLVEELGDVLFYVSMACNSLNISIEQVLSENVKKLSKRYALGSFSEQEAQQRADKQVTSQNSTEQKNS